MAARGDTSEDADLCRASPTQDWMSGRHEVNSAVRETRSQEEWVHGSAKLCVVAVRSPEGAVPEGTASGRAFFFFPLRSASCAHAAGRDIAGTGVILSPRADSAF